MVNKKELYGKYAALALLGGLAMGLLEAATAATKGRRQSVGYQLRKAREGLVDIEKGNKNQPNAWSFQQRMVARNDLPISDPQTLELAVITAYVRWSEICVPKNPQAELDGEQAEAPEGCWLRHVPHIRQCHTRLSVYRMSHLRTIAAWSSRRKKEI